MGDYLDRLARHVRFDDLSALTVRAAKAVVLDTLGAILAGSRLDENAKLADLAAERSGHRTATPIGRARKVEPMFAALANATAGVALEMDEGNRWGGGHPSIHVLPAALAVAEELLADGPRFIEALVASYEITSRLGGATRQRADGVTARVAIALRDGRTLAGETRVAHGDATDPPDRGERLEKFAMLAEPVIGATRVEKVVGAVDNLELMKDMRALTGLVTTIR